MKGRVGRGRGNWKANGEGKQYKEGGKEEKCLAEGGV